MYLMMMKMKMPSEWHDIFNHELTHGYRMDQFLKPVRRFFLKLGYIKPLSDKDNRTLLRYAAYHFIVESKITKPVALNCAMYKFYRQMRWKMDLRLPYYWGPYGVHVVYRDFTDAVRLVDAKGLYEGDF
jgi:hypothetical protein